MKRFPALFLLVSALFLLVPVSRAQTGHVLNGVGPIDQGMSGAGMAAPQDALTALHWNPAAMVTKPGCTLDVGIQLMMPTGTITSTVQAGAFGPQFGPPVTMSGSTDSEAGPFPIPSLGLIIAPEGSKWAFGFSAYGVGGFGVDYAASTTNPILTPQMPQGGMGFGAMNSSFMLLQVSPSVAYRVNDKVSIGFAPTWNMANLKLSVFPATAPQFIDAFQTPGVPQDDLPLYPDAPGTWAMGYGFQAGVHAVVNEDLSVGISYKSPQAFNDFEYQPETAGAADYTFRMDFPMIVSGSLAWTGVENLLLALDVRYIDYANTKGFDDVGFDQNMAVKGFGWDAVTVVAIGAQYELAEGFPVRVGYAWNNSPIADDLAFFNAPAPALVEQHISAGFSYEMSDKLKLSFAGQYAPNVESAGYWKSPMFGPSGENPATSITNELSTLTLIGGVSVSF
jgi:long-chain fatty acid transport protein